MIVIEMTIEGPAVPYPRNTLSFAPRVMLVKIDQPLHLLELRALLKYRQHSPNVLWRANERARLLVIVAENDIFKADRG